MSNETVIQISKATIFQENNPVVSDVNVEIKKGEFVYLIGKTGSGKSSLLKTLYGELPLKQGTGSVAGFDLTTLKRKDVPFLRRKLGIVFQDFQLLSDRSVYENLRFVMKATGWKNEDEIRKQITEVLNEVALSGKGEKMPFELSGGEQQRVTVARALVNNPEIILADEPTGNLDPETSQEVMTLLLSIAKSGTAIVFATHDFILYNKYPARTLKFENGKISELN
ncbi:MAG: ATP-binding cassette domain-containing protein [Bacteroidetes bacterium]|nr:ATP-binding cassette domain-containing protein [Bacteroidota bacterium]